MRSPRIAARNYAPRLEELEERALATLVFVFNGNAFRDARPDGHTADAARALQNRGFQAVQMAYPTLDTVATFNGVARRILSISHGQPIGLMGFSAGGSLAARLAGIAALNVKAALNFYGPPDLADWLNYHRGDAVYMEVTGHVHLTRRVVNLLSGPSPTDAFVVNALGLQDTNVVAGVSTSSFAKDFRSGHVYTYQGPHGVLVAASPEAFDDFVEHLPITSGP